MNDFPKGTWFLSARNIKKIENDILSCELKRKNNDEYNYQYLKFNMIDNYINIDGLFFKKSDRKILIEQIPKNIFQTHKSLEYIQKKLKLKMASRSWKKYVPEFKYHFYDDKMCEDFIKTKCDDKIFQAYMKCPFKVMKADIWRYCIIYEYGGIYADMDTILLQDPLIFLQSSAYLVLAPETDSLHLCQWTFAAPPKSPILKEIIDLVVDRVLNNQDFNREHIIHELTGPRAFTDGIETYLKKLDCTLYENKLNYDRYQNYIIHVFSSDYFHNSIIRHLYCGNDPDGWKNLSL